MRKIAILILIAFAAQVSFANDGVFYASGNNLIPLQESQVELKKELLKFFVVDHEYMNVEVDFEFYNPGKAKQLTVGFLTPPADGDVTEEMQKHPFISAFTVKMNGKALPFKIKKLKDTSFQKAGEETEGDDFVYYFTANFAKGINRIRHTYRFRGSSGVEMARAFDYQITTGKRWANKQIDDFELQIHPDLGIFALQETFQSDGKRADWQIVGDGIITDWSRAWFGNEELKMRFMHLNSGYLRLKAKNFRPDADIMFGELNWGAMWSHLWCGERSDCYDKDALENISRYIPLRSSENYETKDFEGLSEKEAKYLRNYFYAIRGLAFKDEELNKFYGQFFWYKPNPALKAEAIKLSKAESRFLDVLRRYKPVIKV